MSSVSSAREPMKIARLFSCTACHLLISICSICDRGNIYCFNGCAITARKKSVRNAKQRYQNTRQGKMMHADRQRCYRERQRQRKMQDVKQKMQHRYRMLHAAKKIVTDHTSQFLPISISLPLSVTKLDIPEAIGISTDIFCHFCGSQCSNLLRRGFIRTTVVKKSVIKAGWPLGP
jgi:hypothetical protein